MVEFHIDSVTPERVTFAADWRAMLALEHLVAQSNLWDQVKEKGLSLSAEDLTPIIRTIREAQCKYRLAGGVA